MNSHDFDYSFLRDTLIGGLMLVSQRAI